MGQILLWRMEVLEYCMPINTHTEPYTPHYRQDFTTEDLNKNECLMTNIWISLESTNALVEAMDK